jgi:hypothetical protein
MRNRRWLTEASILWAVAVAVASNLLLAGCGSGGQATIGAQRQLVSIAVQPSDADAFLPSGTVPFGASGTFDQAPTTQTNLPAHWASSDSTVATIDANNGLATCVTSGGPITITASAPGRGGMLVGSATLTCMVSTPLVGHCLVTFGSVRNGAMSGFCSAEQNGACRQAYDPRNCPPGRPGALIMQEPCGSVDTSRSCTP